MNLRTALASTVTVGLLGSGLALAPSASASHDPEVRTQGNCSAGATVTAWKLKVKADDGALEVEAEVDSNRAGQVWSWTLSDNSVLTRSGSAKTVAPSGSFSVERRISNRAGTDHVVFRAVRAGQVCTARASL